MNRYVFVLDQLDPNHGTFLNFYNEDERIVLERKLITQDTSEGDVVIFTDYSFTKYFISKEKTKKRKENLEDILNSLKNKK